MTKTDIYPLPRADDILESLSSAHYFSHFDLVRGYWQSEPDHEKTAFSTPDGHYQFQKMSFGLTNAPASFLRAMDVILRGLSWVDLVVYLDDILVFGITLEEHRRHLVAFLGRLEIAGLKIKPEKPKILPQKLELLGHIVTKDGISVDPQKIKVINKWSSPSNLHKLRSFLGHTGYYQYFIPNYAEITAPLRHMEHKRYKI